MSITYKDIMDMTTSDEQQLEMYEYWSNAKHDPRLDSPLDMVKAYQKLTGQEPDPMLYSNLIDEEYDELMDSQEMEEGEAFSGEDYIPEFELKELSDLVYVIYGYANAMGWDLDEAVRRVHENNMGRMYQLDGTIRRRGDGKIMKNKDYPPVELGDLV